MVTKMWMKMSTARTALSLFRQVRSLVGEQRFLNILLLKSSGTVHPQISFRPNPLMCLTQSDPANRRQDVFTWMCFNRLEGQQDYKSSSRIIIALLSGSGGIVHDSTKSLRIEIAGSRKLCDIDGFRRVGRSCKEGCSHNCNAKVIRGYVSIAMEVKEDKVAP